MTVEDYIPLNFGLMGNWQNWVYVTLMIVIFAFFTEILFSIKF